MNYRRREVLVMMCDQCGEETTEEVRATTRRVRVNCENLTSCVPFCDWYELKQQASSPHGGHVDVSLCCVSCLQKYVNELGKSK